MSAEYPFALTDNALKCFMELVQQEGSAVADYAGELHRRCVEAVLRERSEEVLESNRFVWLLNLSATSVRIYAVVREDFGGGPASSGWKVSTVLGAGHRDGNFRTGLWRSLEKAPVETRSGT